jgi:HK97 gp10 family phage protein
LIKIARLELEGMDELLDRVNKMGQRGEEIKKNALNKAADLVKRSMESKAPRSNLNKTHLADNIKVSDIVKNDGFDYIRIGPLESDFYYSIFTELGTRNIPAQHWMAKSVLENKREINRIIKEELERGIGV